MQSASSALASSITVHFDASSKTYTITAPIGSQSFAPGDVQTSAPGVTTYSKTQGSTQDALVLAGATPNVGTTLNYVGLGFWLHGTQSGSTGSLDFETFDYGIPTPTASVPRTGSAEFAVGAFGLLATPGHPPYVVSQSGTFTADFQAGQFGVDMSPANSNLVSQYGLDPGNGILEAYGTLSSSDGSFSGKVGYGLPLFFGAQTPTLSGQIVGRLYGPSAQEIGATFALSDASGDALAGTLVGANDGKGGAVPSLVGITSAYGEDPYGANLTLTQSGVPGGFTAAASVSTSGGVSFYPDGTFSGTPDATASVYMSFGPSNKVASSLPNFDTYQASGFEVDLYKVGPSNSELALSYVSFGDWSFTATNRTYSLFFTDGVPTPPYQIAMKTGTAHYSGVAYGAAADSALSASYNVTGTSTFDVNFSNSTATASLVLSGKNTSDGTVRNFGEFDAGGPTTYQGLAGDLTQGGAHVGTMNVAYFGPYAAEIGGTFTVNNSSLSIAGAAAAKQH